MQAFRSSRRSAVLLTFLSTVVLPTSPNSYAAQDQRPPNFVIILCDNLGYGDIEPFGSQVHRTPQLNRMAREGRKLTHFYVSSGVCTPSRASLMTGCYAQRIGMHTNPRDGRVLRPVSPYGLHPDETTIAEVLKPKGYATALIGKWHLGDQQPFLPTSQGFDLFFGIPYSDDMTQAVGHRLGDRFQGNQWPPLPLMQNESVLEAPVDRNTLTERYTQKSIDFIKAHQGDPFLLVLSHAMPGSTSQPFASKRFQGTSNNGPWGDAVEEIDWSTGAILDALVDMKLDQHTLVVWTSDNGAPSTPGSLKRGTNQPLYGRGYSTSEGAFRVPTIAWWPKNIPAGTVSDNLMTTMDLLPTFAALANTPAPQKTIDGRDISKSLQGVAEDAARQEPFFYYDEEQLQAVRRGPYKLFVPLNNFVRHPHFKKGQGDGPLLFDVVTDIGCATNIAAQHPEIVAQLTTLVAKQREQLGDNGQAGLATRPRGDLDKPPAPQRIN